MNFNDVHNLQMRQIEKSIDKILDNEELKIRKEARNLKMVTGKDMQNKGITINLDKERHMKFDLNAFCELEDRFGDINTAFEELQKMSMKTIRTLLFLGLSHEDDTLTEKKVGSLITIDNINNIADIISSAMNKSMPDVEDAEDIKEEKNE